MIVHLHLGFMRNVKLLDLNLQLLLTDYAQIMGDVKSPQYGELRNNHIISYSYLALDLKFNYIIKFTIK